MALTKIPDMPLENRPDPGFGVPAWQPNGTLNPRIGKAGLLYALARDESVDVDSGTLALTDAHFGQTIVLNGPGASISLDTTASPVRGPGFWVNIWNKRGSDWPVPTPTGCASVDPGTDPSALKVKDNGHATLVIRTRGGTRYCVANGDMVV